MNVLIDKILTEEHCGVLKITKIAQIAISDGKLKRIVLKYHTIDFFHQTSKWELSAIPPTSNPWCTP